MSVWVRSDPRTDQHLDFDPSSALRHSGSQSNRKHVEKWDQQRILLQSIASFARNVRKISKLNRQTQAAKIMRKDKEVCINIPLQLQPEIPRFDSVCLGTEDCFNFDEQRNGNCFDFWVDFGILQHEKRPNLQYASQKHIHTDLGAHWRASSLTWIHSHSDYFSFLGHCSQKIVLKTNLCPFS